MSNKRDGTRGTATVAGVWERLWEEDPIGDAEGADRGTLVLWTQTPCGIYVDMRLPMGAPGRSRASAIKSGYTPRPSALGTPLDSAEYSQFADDLAISIILKQKSFGGILQYSHGDTTSGEALLKDASLAKLAAAAGNESIPLCTCFWRRDLDYQPPSGGLDIGVCASEPPNVDGSIDMRETGSDASYAEGWRRLVGTADGPFLALELISESGHEGRVGYWVRAGSRFAYAVGRPQSSEAAQEFGYHPSSALVAESVGKSLSDALLSLGSGDVRDKMSIAWSYVAVTGEIESDGIWRILSSIQPELVGCALVGGPGSQICCSILSLPCGDGISGNNTLVDQVIAGDVVRRWKLVECIGCSLPIYSE